MFVLQFIYYKLLKYKKTHLLNKLFGEKYVLIGLFQYLNMSDKNKNCTYLLVNDVNIRTIFYKIKLFFIETKQ